MRDFKLFKTLQLIIEIGLVATILVLIFKNKDLYHAIAVQYNLKVVFIIFWLLQVTAFIYLIYDFTVYTDLKRKYAEIDMAMYSDSLTGIGNRSSLDAFIESYKNKDLPVGMGAITFMLTNLSEINNEFGESEGDYIIKSFSNELAEHGKGKCFVGRNGGNTFLALFKDSSEKEIVAFIEEINAEIEALNARSKGAALKYSEGYAVYDGKENMTISELVSKSYRNSRKQA